MREIPEELRSRPFTRPEAIAAGVSSRMLQGKRFVPLHAGVYRWIGLTMTPAHAIEAARLALPEGARTTGITRLQALGLDYGPREPLHFVVEGDLHLAPPGVFLHRTVLMPLADDRFVEVAGAFVAYCATARVIDAVKVGDWLLHRDHLDALDVLELVEAQPWRDGAAEARWILQHLDADARSLPESEMRLLLAFAGLPEPEVNQPLDPTGLMPYLIDLYYRLYLLGVEYEGSQHQVDRVVYTGDIGRYADLRRAGVRYVQVTKEMLARPRSMVIAVHRELVAAGYDGPAPRLDQEWSRVFGRVSDMPGLPRRSRRRTA